MIYNLNIQKFLIYIFPISLISGPLIPEIIILFSLLIFFFNKKKEEILECIKNKIFILFFIFWLYILFSSLFSFVSEKSIIKSFFFIRFPLFSLIILDLLKNDENFKKFLFYILISLSLVLLIDASYQSIFNENIIGQKLIPGRASSFFGDELILGSYIVRIFPILVALILLQKENNLIIFYFLIPSVLTLLILTGERSSFLIFCIYIVLLFLIIKIPFKKLFILFLLSVVLISFTNDKFVSRFILDSKAQLLTYKNIKIPIYYSGFFLSAIEQFKKNPIIGNGVRSFRVNCKDTLKDLVLEDKIPWNRNWHSNRAEKHLKDNKCSTHPHNIILEFLSELGLIGIIFLFSFYWMIIRKLILIYKRNINYYSKENLAYIILISSAIIAFFPLIPSGSFFNNWLLMIYFFNIGFIMYAFFKVKQ